MGQGVERRADGLFERKSERQLRLVDDRDDPCTRPPGLQQASLVAHPEVRRPLRSGVRRRNREEGQSGLRRHRLRRVDRAPTTRADDEVGSCGRGLRRLDRVERAVPANAREALVDGYVQIREPCRRDEHRSRAAELREQRSGLRESPANDHEPTRPLANSTNSWATRDRGRPDDDASEISRVASRPCTRASPSVPVSRFDSTAVREMNVTP